MLSALRDLKAAHSEGLIDDTEFSAAKRNVIVAHAPSKGGKAPKRPAPEPQQTEAVKSKKKAKSGVKAAPVAAPDPRDAGESDRDSFDVKSYSFPVDYNDCFETSIQSYVDIVPLLHHIATKLGDA